MNVLALNSFLHHPNDNHQKNQHDLKVTQSKKSNQNAMKTGESFSFAIAMAGNFTLMRETELWGVQLVSSHTVFVSRLFYNCRKCILSATQSPIRIS
jgi:hypothetical protein